MDGMQMDMFKEPENKRPEPELTKQQKEVRRQAEYDRYISSSEWKKKRTAFIEMRNGECQRCGVAATDVHHIHYDTFKKERLEDVEVLCKSCHGIADSERVRKQMRLSESRLEEARFEGLYFSYMVTKHGDEDTAQNLLGDETEYQEFLEWHDGKQEDGFY